jgi:hypothetical protein
MILSFVRKSGALALIPRPLVKARPRAKSVAERRYAAARYELARVIAICDPDSAEVAAAAHACRLAAIALETEK